NRVILDESHSTEWESATPELNATEFGRETVYTYRTLVDVLSEHYDTRVWKSGELTRDVLRECDVLILKTPTSRFTPVEINAIDSFVADGGGLFMIGDHTNLLGMTD